MNQFMKRAIELALNNVKESGQPFGAVLIKDNEVYSEGVNELHKTYDVSGHAELLAIRRAQEQLQTNDYQGLRCMSGEPCPMCLTAMYFASIEKVIYCQSIEDAVEAGLGESQFIYNELKKAKEERSHQIIQIELTDEQDNPMKAWKNLQF